MASTNPAQNRRLWQWLTLAAILLTFAINIWSNFAPINGQTIGQISNVEFADVLVIPANYAFAIWGLIYVALFGFGIFQLLPEQRNNPRLQGVRPLMIAACIAQSIWVFFFLYRQFWLSVLAMITILLALIFAYLKLEVGRRSVSRAERWLAQIPFGIYLGWISVATIVNVAIALYSQGWSLGIPPVIWTVVLMIIAAAIGLTLTLQRREIAFPLVVVWALLAIATRQATIPLILITAAVLSLGLTVLSLMQLVSRLKRA